MRHIIFYHFYRINSPVFDTFFELFRDTAEMRLLQTALIKLRCLRVTLQAKFSSSDLRAGQLVDVIPFCTLGQSDNYETIVHGKWIRRFKGSRRAIFEAIFVNLVSLMYPNI